MRYFTSRTDRQSLWFSTLHAIFLPDFHGNFAEKSARWRNRVALFA
jgi:hypothetical protein